MIDILVSERSGVFLLPGPTPAPFRNKVFAAPQSMLKIQSTGAIHVRRGSRRPQHCASLAGKWIEVKKAVPQDVQLATLTFLELSDRLPALNPWLNMSSAGYTVHVPCMLAGWSSHTCFRATEGRPPISDRPLLTPLQTTAEDRTFGP